MYKKMYLKNTVFIAHGVVKCVFQRLLKILMYEFNAMDALGINDVKSSIIVFVEG